MSLRLRQSIRKYTSQGRLVRFLAVGMSGLVVNNLAMWLLVEAGRVQYLFSAVLATQSSTLWNFTLTDRWVFKDRKAGRSLPNRVGRYFLMNNIALLLRGPILILLVEVVGLHYILANVSSIIGMALLRYLLSSRWIWLPSYEEADRMSFSYDIHGIITVESEVFLPELEYFLVETLARAPDLRLRMERRKRPRPSDRAIRYEEGLGQRGFALSIVPGECTEIQVSSLVRYSPHVLYTNVFEPLLRWAFVRKGYALVHAACLDHDSQGTLITARTDTGKTTTILRCLQALDYSFLSDDMTLIDRDGRLFSYPKPLTISAHTLRAVPKARLTQWERFTLNFQSLLHSRSGRKFALWLMRTGLPAATINAIVQILIPPPKYHVTRLIPDVEVRERSSLKNIIQIERGPSAREIVDHDAMLEELSQNAEDAFGFPPYPDLRDLLSRWRGEDLHNRERQIIKDAMTACLTWRVRSERYDWWEVLPDITSFASQNSIPVGERVMMHTMDTQPVQ